MLLEGFCIVWTIISMVYGFYHSFDPILRPHPVPCGNQTCLYFTNHVLNKSGLIPTSLFNLNSNDQGETILFWLIDSNFLAYHNESIYFLSSPASSYDPLLTIDYHLVPFDNLDYRLIILGNDVLIAYRFINGVKLNPTLNQVDLFRSYRIDIINKKLIHLDSISFDATLLTNLDRFIVLYGVKGFDYSYLTGIRTLQETNQLFSVRLCLNGTLASYVELYQIANFIPNDIDFNDSFTTYSMAVEPIAGPNQRLLTVLQTEDSLIVFPINVADFDDTRQQCAQGSGSVLGSVFSDSIELDCYLALNVSYTDPCDGSLTVQPMRALSSSNYWTSSIPVTITLFYLSFPVHSYIAITVTATGDVTSCLLKTPPFFPSDWECGVIGNISTPDNPLTSPIFPPFLNPKQGIIQVYSSVSNSIISFNLMSCQFLTDCLSCNLFGQYFNCRYEDSKCQSLDDLDGNYTPIVDYNAEQCLQINSISPDIIILSDLIVQFTLELVIINPHDSIVLQGYEIVIFVNGDPCLSTITNHLSEVYGFHVTCNLGPRVKGIWPVTYSVGTNENTNFAPRFIPSHQFVNITIDGVPAEQHHSTSSTTYNILKVFSWTVFSLIVLFLLSLRLKTKVKPNYGKTVANERTTSSPFTWIKKIGLTMKSVESAFANIKNKTKPNITEPIK